MTLNDTIKRIPLMSDSEVTAMLGHANFIARTKALWEATERGLSDSRTLDAIRKLKEDSTVFWNQYLVQDFAIAALDILGTEKYNGQSERINVLIQSRLQFN